MGLDLVFRPHPHQLVSFLSSCAFRQINIPQADLVKEEEEYGLVRKGRKIGQIPGAPFSGNAGKLKGRRITGVHSAQLHGHCGEHCRLCRLLQICGEHWCILVHIGAY